ncbi:MAG: L-malate glycosyltransferase [Clostridium butyricum]|nr:L-malate glycosyltransferase [Clostridium butyricum]MDN5316934.1 L-malate glycosyltransferase [Thermoanaerobacterium sp.]
MKLRIEVIAIGDCKNYNYGEEIDVKILHINSYYSSSSFYKNLYDNQIENGLDIDVFVPISSSVILNNSDLGKYTTVSVNHGKYDRILFFLKHNKIYKDIIRRFKIGEYSVIHAHSLFSNGYIAYKLKQEYGVPYIVAVRNTDVNVFFKYMVHLRKLGIQILQEADKVIFLSKSYRDFVIQKYVPEKFKKEIFNKAEIIPNGIDDFWFNNKGNIRNTPDKNNLKLLYVGAINKNKNIIITIKAIKILQNEGYNINFTVVGKVEDKSIFNQIKNLSFITYITPKPKEELINIYRANDIFIMPSKTETFGLVYAEAMSQGIPVIYTKGQGFDGQFEEGIVGYSVQHDSAEEIVERVKAILDDYKTISNNCINKVDKFDWDEIAKGYYSIYEDAL